MSPVTTTIRDARIADIAYIMSVERLPDYPERVGAWTEAEHAEKMADPSYRYILGLVDDVPVGFVIFKDIGDSMGNLCLHRIAVGDAGRGVGTSFVGNLCHWAFSDPAVFRLWLDVLPSNPVARHVYAKAGFVEEGLMRSALRYPDGRRADLLLMALLRPDWQALHTATTGTA
jgi:RimJ/RimL family protein N-acetyltransferase